MDTNGPRLKIWPKSKAGKYKTPKPMSIMMLKKSWHIKKNNSVVSQC